MREEPRLRVFEDKVLKRIFGLIWRSLQVCGEIYIMMSLMICTPHPICSCDKIEKNEMVGTCSMYGGEERCIEGFGGET